MTRTWTQVDVGWTSDSQWNVEILSGWLLTLGFESTEVLPNDLGIRFFVPPHQSSKTVIHHLRAMLATSYGEQSEELKMETAAIEEKDWMEEWKKGFDVLQLSDHLWICPSWKSFQPEKGQYSLNMDPGMAFGTGHHASTKLIAQAMEDQIFDFLARRQSPTLLDVGTGTGVLSMGAALLGAERIVAVDNDPEALIIAEENVGKNELDKKITIERLPIEKLRRKFDLIVANIIAEVHYELLPYYIKRIIPNGVLLMSGIIQERVDMVRTRVEEQGWIILNRREQGEWVCVTCIRERRRKKR